MLRRAGSSSRSGFLSAGAVFFQKDSSKKIPLFLAGWIC
jgi:hypothetical protein